MTLRTHYLLCMVTALATVLERGLAQQWPLPGSCGSCSCFLKGFNFGPRRYVNCSGQSFSTPPNEIPDHVDILDLSHNAISSDSVGYACNTRTVLELNLSFNKIHSLRENAFAGCRYLTVLDLSGNRLTLIESGAFNGLTNLQSLLGLVTYVFDSSTLKPLQRLKELECTFHGFTLPPYTFGGPVLQRLSLRLTAVEHLEPILSHENPSLLEISIDGKDVRQINDSLLNGLVRVRQMRLKFPSLPSLPLNMFHDAEKGQGVRNLQYLTVQGVFRLPSNLLDELVNLRNLSLIDIGALPRIHLFDQLSGLEHLNLSGSRVSQIPSGWLFGLSSLSSLTMQGADLERLLREDFSGLQTLQRLDLSGNGIKDIESLTFAPMRSFLQALSLERNVLKRVDADTFSKLVFLQELDLGSNKLSVLNESAFADLSQLRTLRLHDNKLVVLFPELFANQINLRKLDLSSNAFLHLPRALLALSGGLQVLNLDENQVGSVPQVLLSEFPNLKLLSLRNNPVLCNCDTEVMIVSRPRLRITGTCDLPPYFYGKSLTSLTTPYFCRTVTTALSLFPSTALDEVTPTLPLASTEPPSSTPTRPGPGGGSDVTDGAYFATPTLPPDTSLWTRPVESRPQSTMVDHVATSRTEPLTPNTKAMHRTTTIESVDSAEERKYDMVRPSATTPALTIVGNATEDEDTSNTTEATLMDVARTRTPEEVDPPGAVGVPTVDTQFNATRIQPDATRMQHNTTPTQPNTTHTQFNTTHTQFNTTHTQPNTTRQEGELLSSSGSGTKVTSEPREHVIASPDLDLNATALLDRPVRRMTTLAMAEMMVILASVAAFITVIVATYIAWFKRRQKQRNTYVIRRRTFSVTSV